MMNRYHSTPTSGPSKALPSTTCQKCLKKGHYSYECKAQLQDRPYASRPSRTQQFKDPKLVPKLTETKPNELSKTNGVADRILADLDAARRLGQQEEKVDDASVIGAERRSPSVSPASSVSTISTNRSLSRSPSRYMQTGISGGEKSRRRSRSNSVHQGQKRRRDPSSASDSRSPSPYRGSHRKNRRHRLGEPDDDRGRPMPRRGSHRSPTRSLSVDKSRVARHRRSIESSDDFRKARPGRTATDYPPQGSGTSRAKPMPDRRSPSPYSRRLALTQAMNM